MRTLSKVTIVTLFVGLLFTGTALTFSATTPFLGSASSYAVLTSTYNNTSSGTTLNGDVGFTTGPVITPTGTHSNYGSALPYSTAGTDQGSALSFLASQACTFTFTSGVIDLATDTTHGTMGVYSPGVYCTNSSSSVSIGSGGIILRGSGTYIFRINGSLTTAVNSHVTIDGASACDVFWTPSATTTLGANSTFVGTNINNSGITLDNNVTWVGRALVFGATVTTTGNDTITVPSCVNSNAKLHIVKLVVNGNNGTATASNFNIYVKTGGTNIAGSPTSGSSVGTVYLVPSGTYTVSENANSSYMQSFSGACDANGNVSLLLGDDKTCTITNTFIPSIVNNVNSVIPHIGITTTPHTFAILEKSGSITYNYTVWNVGTKQAIINVKLTDNKCSPVRFLSGDGNNNDKLDINEKWKYSCNTNISRTTTNTAVATGYSDDSYHRTTTASDESTVTVGEPLVAPRIHVMKESNQLTPLPFVGGNVIYTYTVTNPGTVPIENVIVTDNKCFTISDPVGDNNENNILETYETWKYICRADITSSTTSTATARGKGNGFSTLAQDAITVKVYPYAIPSTSTPSVTTPVVIPHLPNAGFPSDEQKSPWYMFIITTFLASIVTFIVVLKKHTPSTSTQ